MKWITTIPITTATSPRINVSSYPKEWAITLNGDLSIGNGDDMVSGIETFIQRFRDLLLSEVTFTSQYGYLAYVPKSKDIERFNLECEALAHKLVNHQYPDSTLDSPKGLGFTIEAVHSIEWDTENDNFTFAITATGYNGELEIFVPISLTSRFADVE